MISRFDTIASFLFWTREKLSLNLKIFHITFVSKEVLHETIYFWMPCLFMNYCDCLEFRILFLLDWLPSKARDPHLFFYLTHCWETDGFLPFPRAFVQKWIQQAKLELEPVLPVSLSRSVTVILCTHEMKSCLYKCYL